MYRYITAILFIVFIVNNGYAQSNPDYTIQLNATTQTSPAKITLNWAQVPGITAYLIYKKSKTATTWGSPLITLTATDSTYTDNTVVADSAYEYYVLGSGGQTATGYIYAGITAPAIHNRGALILMVDSIFTDSCATEITRLMKDISGDGWQVIRHDVSRFAVDTVIKNLIKSDYYTYTNVQTVLLLGHVPVPYSGDIVPDGHFPQHVGAWPADAYYGDVNGVWGDVSVSDTLASYAANINKPNDGKWDPSTMPSTIELEVGRVDFYNMPVFAKTEIQMMRSYLNRDHEYKMDALNIKHRSLIDDNFPGYGGEAFAASGWRNFAVLTGRNNINTVDFITTLKDSTYIWAYGCGGGTFTSAGGIGNTTDFTTNNVNGIFTMLFGSFFGDWNVQNNFMKAPLCANVPALTSCWAGRPHWFFHHMALGECIGYSTRLSQNNTNQYQNAINSSAHSVHISLLGDPTLRMDYITPISNLVLSNVPYNTGAHLTWTASTDAAVIGYYVYRSDSQYGIYKKVSPMLTTTAYHDSVGNSNGLKYYMVRPVKLQQTPSGSYYNLGIGASDSVTVSYPVAVSTVANPGLEISLYPNPTNDKLNLLLNATYNADATCSIINTAGKQMLTFFEQLKKGENTITINVANLPTGNYTLLIKTGTASVSKKWVKIN